METPKNAKMHSGSCHCGAVRFQVRADATAGSRCNCSICTKVAFLGCIAGPDDLTVQSGEGDLSSYEWGGRTAKRYFCKHCGVHCFGRGFLEQLGGHYVSVNLNTLDDIDPAQAAVVHWDGRHDNWMAGPRPEPWPIVAPK
jgi:hypothetical protein